MTARRPSRQEPAATVETSGPAVRAAGPDDLTALLELIESAYRGESSRLGWTTEADLLAGSRTDAGLLGDTLADQATTVLVLDGRAAGDGSPRTVGESGAGQGGAVGDGPGDTGAGQGAPGPDGGLLACCAVTLGVDGVAEFGTFEVRPTAQGAGIGSRMLMAALAHARAAGATRMEMTVIAQRGELVAWYRRRGVEPTGRTRAFPYGDARYGRPLRDDLVFAVLAASLDGS